MEKAKVPTLNMKVDDISSLREEYLNKLKNDKAVYAKIQEMGLSNKTVSDNLGLLMDYQEDFDYCLHCPGLEACAKATPHYEMGITVDGDFLDRRYSPCHRIANKIKLDSRYLIRSFPDEWCSNDLNNIDKTKNRNPLILQLIKIAGGSSNQWIFVNGNYKTGRSFILACFANAYANEGHVPVAFVDTVSLVEELKTLSIQDKKAFDAKMKALQEAPLIVFDDFGNEYKSDFAFSTLLFPLLNYRSKNNLLTMFTSDFSIEEIGQMYAEKIAPARGRQLAGLLKALCEKEFSLDGVAVYR